MKTEAAPKDHQAKARLALPRGYRRHQRPLGSPTRGKTAPGRLRGLDILALRYAPQLFLPRRGRDADAAFVDLGYGETPDTTLESATRFRLHDPDLPVVGYEIDRARVEDARANENERTRFRHGGFDFTLEAFDQGEPPLPARLVRAFNVLRQYDEPSAATALATMMERVEEGGLLIEGTSDPTGRLWSSQLVRSTPEGPRLEALAFSTPGTPDFSPAALRAVLPKRFVHRVVPGEALHAFFERWEREWRLAAPLAVWGEQARLAGSVRAMRRQDAQSAGFHVDPRSRWLRRGIVIWRCPLDCFA